MFRGRPHGQGKAIIVLSRVYSQVNSLLRSVELQNIQYIVLGTKITRTKLLRPYASSRSNAAPTGQIYPRFHSTLHSTRPNVRPRTPLYGLYVSPLSLSWSTLSALSNAPGGSAKETCAARAGRGCASPLTNVPCNVAVRPELVGGSDQRSVRRTGTYVH